MAIEVSPNTSTTRNTKISVDSPDAAAIDTGGSEQEHIDHIAKEGAERASKRINDNKTNIPGSSEFTK
jgi:hypothetical protein